MVNHPSQQSDSALDSIKHIRSASGRVQTLHLSGSQPVLDSARRSSWISIKEIKKIVEPNPMPTSSRTSNVNPLQSECELELNASPELGSQPMYNSLSLKYIREQVSGENIRKQQPIFFNQKGGMIQRSTNDEKGLAAGQKSRRNPTMDHLPSTAGELANHSLRSYTSEGKFDLKGDDDEKSSSSYSRVLWPKSGDKFANMSSSVQNYTSEMTE